MAELDIRLEIHAPGLDLHHRRWNYHVMFMDEVHKHFEAVAALAWGHYQKRGRGTLFVSKEQWLEVIKADWMKNGERFPCRYIAYGSEPEEHEVDFGSLREGFARMLRDYDPTTHFILSVEHHSAGLLSAYLLWSDPGPSALHHRRDGAGP